MTFDELLILIERNYFKSKVDFTIAIKLFDAENDWPEESITINEFINKVEMEIGDDIFYQNLVSKLDSYNSINNAWKVESLMSVKDILELDVTRNFKSIINEFIENNCPLYNENSKRNYINYMKKNYGYTEDRLNKLTMKSDKLYGIAVQIAEDNIGVILYEKISIGEKDFNDKCAMLKQKSNRYANYLTKYIQQAIKFDRSINLKNKNLNTRAEDGLFQTFKEGK